MRTEFKLTNNIARLKRGSYIISDPCYVMSDADYEGTKTETLIIGKATPVITPNSNHLIQFEEVLLYHLDDILDY